MLIVGAATRLNARANRDRSAGYDAGMLPRNGILIEPRRGSIANHNRHADFMRQQIDASQHQKLLGWWPQAVGCRGHCWQTVPPTKQQRQ